MKITGGAGFSADAIEVFEGINGTLLLAALSLVIFLLIVIYRSPMFFLIPLVAVIFAEMLSRSIGYGVSELGVTINGQSSSIMSVLVLGAGTDYALLLVSRYREELHRTVDKHEAMRTALASAGPAIFASAATVIAALLCLMLAKVNGTAGLGPIAAIGIACAALSMLTLLPALLTIFGRRAFWPFVPHTPETAPSAGRASPSERGDGSSKARAMGALARVIVACLLVLVLLPLVLLNWILRRISGRRIPSLIVGPLDRAVFTPYEMRRHKLEHAADATHGFWKRVGDRVAVSPRRVMLGSIAVLLILCAGFAFFSTDLTTEDSYRTEVESVEGQHLLDKSFPSGTTALDRHRRRRTAPTCEPVRSAVVQSRRRRGGLAAGRRRAAGHPGPGDAGTQPLLDRGLRPDRADPRGRPRSRPRHPGRRPDRGRIRRPRRRRLGLDRDPADHPPRRLPDPDRPAARRGRAADPDRHGDPQLPRRARRRLLRLRRSSSTSPARTRRCRSSPSSSWSRWGSTTTSS